MSKITPKNLQYDTSLPPFLQRMQASQNSSSRDGRHEFAIARPKRARNEEEEREDEPVYFDETSGETLTKGEWEEREKKKESPDVAADADGEAEKRNREHKDKVGEKEGKEKEKVAAIGVGKKRKVGKVVGGDEEDDNGKTADLKKLVVEKKNEVTKVEKGKTGKKAKKIKLSFGDDE